MPGTVYLIGAGPGDPGLITQKGLDCLRRADCVVYDHLANDSLLLETKPETAVMSGDDTGIFGMTALLAACSPLLVIAALAKRRGRKALSVPDCRAGERLPR